MAKRRYDKQKLYEQACEAIKQNNLFFISDVLAFLPCDKATFYRTFPADSEESNYIKELLDNNKVKTKSSIRAKLFRSEKAGELLSLYKLICTDEERRRLSQQYVENSVDQQNNKLKIEIVNDS